MTNSVQKPLETHLWFISSKGIGSRNKQVYWNRIPMKKEFLLDYYKQYYVWYPRMNYILNLLWNAE